ncbi:hypothetical protein CHH83_01715 [Bacillus sp. 7586-K]|nr:hypothetical protein CHH83_01715 [Bacillus sp. 7586-K]
MRSIASNLNERVEQLNWLRSGLLVQLQELQADFEDLSDEDLIECRGVMLQRVNDCLEGLEESDEDNQ